MGYLAKSSQFRAPGCAIGRKIRLPDGVWPHSGLPMHDKTFPTLDAFDRKILARHQHDTRLPAALIGAEVGLSAAAVQRRLKRMRDAGIIEAETAQLSPRALGFPVTCIVAVDLRDESAAELARFKARMVDRGEVQQCYYVTGAADFMLVVA